MFHLLELQCLISFIIILFSDNICAVSKIDDFNLENYRLSNTTIPLYYDIHIETMVESDEFKFNGTVQITFLVVKPTKNIVLHSKDSIINTAEISNSNNQISNVIKNIYFNKTTDIMLIETNDILKQGVTHTLKLTYNSILREDNLGFYRSWYINEKGEKIWIAVTQFAPTEARHAFPCYDEPAIKTPFQLRITHPKNRIAISNTDPKTLKENDDGTITTEFKLTKQMSAYLIAFVICDYSNITANYSDLNTNKEFETVLYKKNMNSKLETNHEIYFRKNIPNSEMDLINFFAVRSYFNLLKYFPIEETPYLKMKGILIPQTHFSGTENWGAIIYKESQLRFNKRLHWGREKIRAVLLLAHEMSHQWFGNLVTMKWWTWVWLNEGFASLYEYYIAEMTYENWNIMEHYQAKRFHVIMNLDINKINKLRPMNSYVEKQTDIMKSYDKIAYDKASCVIRMFEHAIGRAVFYNGINIYLQERCYKDSTETNLVDALTKAALNSNHNFNVNLHKAVASWTLKSGFPYINVNIINDIVQVSQSQFLTPDAETYPLWYIPINFVTSYNKNFNNTSAEFWLTTKSISLNFNSYFTSSVLNSSDFWIIFNVQQTGYYRVNYDNNNWMQIIRALKKQHSDIHVANRAQIIDDLFVFTRKNQVNYEILFEMLQYLKHERNYAPWAAFDSGIEFLYKAVRKTSSYNNFLLLMKDILTPAADFFINFGNITDFDLDPLKALNREIIFRRSFEFGIFNKTVKIILNETQHRQIYYCNKLKISTENTNEILKEIYSLIKFHREDPWITNDLIKSLGCIKNELNIKILLLKIFKTTSDPELNLNSNEKVTVLKSLCHESYLGLEMTLEMTFSKWQQLLIVLDYGNFVQFLLDASTYIFDKNLLKKFQDFINILPLTSKDQIDIYVNIDETVEWNYVQGNSVVTWLQANYPISFNRATTSTSATSSFLAIIFLFILSTTVQVQF